MIGVQSYPELYTTLLGWKQYNNLWSIMTQTGLAFIPFIALFVRNFVDPSKSQSAKGASETSLKRVEIELSVMVLVIMFAAQPLITMNPSVLTFKPVCNDKVDAKPGNTKTTYDRAFTDYQGSVKVPIVWYAVMGVAQGFSGAASIGLGCPVNFRRLRMEVDAQRIKSPELRAEAQEFMANCWHPAKAKLIMDKPDLSRHIKEHGYADVDWPGSRTLQGLTGYYDTLHAAHPVKGFKYQEGRDFEQGSNAQWGTPSCKEWWSSSGNGLYARLQKEVSPNLVHRLKAVARPGKGNVADEVVREMLDNSIKLASGYEHDKEGVVTGAVSYADMLVASPKFYAMIRLLVESAPLVQALLLMLCYTFLPILLVFSGYRISTVFQIALVIFSVILWHFLWNFSTYIEDILIKALFPSELQYVTNRESMGSRKLLVDMILSAMYLALPMMLTLIMGWAGIRAGGGMQGGVDKLSSSAGASAGAGSGIAISAISKGIGKK